VEDKLWKRAGPSSARKTAVRKEVGGIVGGKKRRTRSEQKERVHPRGDCRGRCVAVGYYSVEVDGADGEEEGRMEGGGRLK